jgi:ABC-2 type transport system permease protein
MIATLLRIGWISLKRDRVALFLTFILPIVFFSIFAFIFSGGGGGGGTQEIDLRLLVVDLDQSDVSQGLVAELDSQEVLTVSMEQKSEEMPDAEPWTRESAHRAVRQGEADAAVVFPSGMSETFGDFGGEAPEIELIFDASNPMAQFTISGLLQAASFQSAPQVLMEKGLGMLEQFGGALTPQQQQAVDYAGPALESGEISGVGSEGLLKIKTSAAHDDSDDDQGPAIVAYYAAGIGVMFLLFSMTGAAGGLLEEQERGTLDRILNSNVSMAALLGSRWIFFSALGLVQVVLMFVWGWAVFDLEIWSVKRFSGVLAMSVVTAAAAASFGLVLAAACKSRAQLGGLSTIVVLVMSALGGSMVPRFVMPDFMATAAKFTINGWALDGFLKVFWYDDPEATTIEALWGLAPEMAVLSALALVFFVSARRLARRWEVA